MPSENVALCECGCGTPTVISKVTDRSHGWTKGQPRRFVAGHNNRLRRLTPVAEDRGYATPCLIWPGSVNERGYGRAFGGCAHVVLWVRENGPVPDGHELDHLCRQRSCVNLDHLEPVTHAENTRRAATARTPSGTDPAGLAIRDLRLRCRLSQSGLAPLLGCSPGLIARWELGLSTPSPERLARLRDLAEGYHAPTGDGETYGRRPAA